MSKESSATDAGNARGGRSPSYTALKLAQNGHNIYFTTIPIDELFDYCIVERRSENPTEDFQRRLSESRADEHGSVTLASLQQVIGPICNPPEDSLPKVQKRDILVEIMRSRLNSDTSISDDDI